jgi:hypothetical protein
VELTNLTVSGYLRFFLPRHYLVCSTRIRGKDIEHRPKLCTIHIKPDEAKLVMVWHSAIRCHRDADALERTRVYEKSYL